MGSGATSTSAPMNKSHSGIDAAILKQHLPTYLKSIGHDPIMQKGWINLKACCPLHDDTNPSFSATKKGHDWEWFCHACRVGGTIIELHALRSNLDPKTQFPTICCEVAEIIKGVSSEMPIIDRPVDLANKKDSDPIPPDELTKMSTQWRSILGEDATLRDKFAHELGLPSELLKWAANTVGDGLGIAPAGLTLKTSQGKECSLREPRLVYIGTGYYKIRAPFGHGSGQRFWMSGQQLRPWLGHLLVPGDTTVKHVHLLESETSALALIAAGAWHNDHSAIVVATSGCGGFKQEWCPLFAGRTVQFWPDADEPGMRFANETAGMLYGVASQIFVRDWNPGSKSQHHE